MRPPRSPSRPEGFGVDELRLTDYVSANAALHASGHELWADLSPVATPHGWTWHHVAYARRMELVPVEVKALLRHHGGLATAAVDHDKRGTRPLQETRPAHFAVPHGRRGERDAGAGGRGAAGLPAARRPTGRS